MRLIVMCASLHILSPDVVSLLFFLFCLSRLPPCSSSDDCEVAKPVIEVARDNLTVITVGVRDAWGIQTPSSLAVFGRGSLTKVLRVIIPRLVMDYKDMIFIMK